jgi:tRNA pseudouridine13 synthase
LKEKGVPNYFGYQRFGTVRPNTHLVGREIVKGNLEKAVMKYLGEPFEGEKRDAYEARAFLDQTFDFKKALTLFPKRLGYERTLLHFLSEHPKDFAGALRRLPKKLRRMFVHAYQSFLFNKILSKAIENNIEIRGKKIPLFGYESAFSEIGDIEKKVLEEENIKTENFKINKMPELASKGFSRDASIDIEPIFTLEKDEITRGTKCIVEFVLPKGSYATVVLREFMKADPLNY